MAYRKGTSGAGKSRLPKDADGPRHIPGTLGRTPHKKVQGRTGYTEDTRMGPGSHGRETPIPKGGS